ncbi:hypothetical protein QJR30_12960 [Paraclostridium sordellii]|uniref:hypothetical protein n=1 Tax=Paraclostridium sordellii TaxID=1505 RepID=UPI0005E6D02D|nr:hypothetical protein [Paeniclostridium sordellii]CEP81409.1 ABC transporter multidrug-family permease [[Clostridium] sordellii] [Paeniclostridium sordellii]
MNKLFTLYDIEFKRIYKLYAALICMLFIGNLVGVVISVKNSVESISLENNLPPNLNILKTNLGLDFINDITIGDIYMYGSFVLAVSVLICLFYAFIIWYRDYFSKCKTIYTLLTLPKQRFNVYLAKLMTVVIMIYGVIVSQILFWYIDLNIVKHIAGIGSPGFVNIFKNMMNAGGQINIVSPNIVEFFMLDIIGVILAVVVIFTAVLIERCTKKIGIILGAVYILISIFGYIYIIVLSRSLMINLLFWHITYYIFLLCISLFISYYLINNKISV